MKAQHLSSSMLRGHLLEGRAIVCFRLLRGSPGRFGLDRQFREIEKREARQSQQRQVSEPTEPGE